MLQFNGCGLPNVWLADGYQEEAFEGDKAYSYVDLMGLYQAIAHALATSPAELTGDEFRFLRKRLEWSQEECGEFLGKTGQAVAKWEKGQAALSRADASLLRLAWLGRERPGELEAFVQRLIASAAMPPEREYVFRRESQDWVRCNRELAAAATAGILRLSRPAPGSR